MTEKTVTVESLAAALVESDLMPRYRDYANQVVKAGSGTSAVELSQAWAERVFAALPATDPAGLDAWLDDIIANLDKGLGEWEKAHVWDRPGVWSFNGADGPFHGLVQGTVRRLKDYAAARLRHETPDATTEGT